MQIVEGLVFSQKDYSPIHQCFTVPSNNCRSSLPSLDITDVRSHRKCQIKLPRITVALE